MSYSSITCLQKSAHILREQLDGPLQMENAKVGRTQVKNHTLASTPVPILLPYFIATPNWLGTDPTIFFKRSSPRQPCETPQQT